MVRLNWIAGMIFAAMLTGCAGQGTPQPATAALGVFAGYYTTSFEVSSFVPCLFDETPGYGAGYWLESEQGSGFFELYSEITADPSATPEPAGAGGVTVFVKFRGILSPPADPDQGGYGHLGQYEREITVTEVIQMALPEPYQCVIP